MGYVYIVTDPSSAFFKFGLSTKSSEARILNYKTAFAKYAKFVFPCENPRPVETAVKHALADHIQRHDSGRKSEICSKGLANANLMRALNIMAAMTMAAHPEGTPVENPEPEPEPEDEPEDEGDLEDFEDSDDPQDDSDDSLDDSDDSQGDPGNSQGEGGDEAELHKQLQPNVITSDPEHVADVLLKNTPLSVAWSRDRKQWIHRDGRALERDEGDKIVTDAIGIFNRKLLASYNNALPPLQKTAIKATIAKLAKPSGSQKLLETIRDLQDQAQEKAEKAKAEAEKAEAEKAEKEKEAGVGAGVGAKLREFLAMRDDERVVSFTGDQTIKLHSHEEDLKPVGQYVVRINTRTGNAPVTLINGFATIFSTWLGRRVILGNLSEFTLFSFNKPIKNYVCVKCGGRHKAFCCEDASREGRVQRLFIDNMSVSLCEIRE